MIQEAPEDQAAPDESQKQGCSPARRAFSGKPVSETEHRSPEKKRLLTDLSVRRRSIFSPRYHFSLPVIPVTHSRRPLWLRSRHFAWAYPRLLGSSRENALNSRRINRFPDNGGIPVRATYLSIIKSRSPRLLAGDNFLAVLFPHTSRELSESS